MYTYANLYPISSGQVTGAQLEVIRQWLVSSSLSESHVGDGTHEVLPVLPKSCAHRLFVDSGIISALMALQ